IETFLQKPMPEVEGMPIVLTTHTVAESLLSDALDRIAKLPAVTEPPRLLRIAQV
ncbi:MAG: homoserine dehydrogenase, partial [Caulobacteraceae bacterium]|nr:homoserine dehydrogenase [Caulobacteraceae bacterium]